MRNRTMLLVVAIIGLVLLAVGSTVGVMTLTHSGFMGNNGSHLHPPYRRSRDLYLQMSDPLWQWPNGNDGVNADSGIHVGNLDRSIVRITNLGAILVSPKEIDVSFILLM